MHRVNAKLTTELSNAQEEYCAPQPSRPTAYPPARDAPKDLLREYPERLCHEEHKPSYVERCPAHAETDFVVQAGRDESAEEHAHVARDPAPRISAHDEEDAPEDLMPAFRPEFVE